MPKKRNIAIKKNQPKRLVNDKLLNRRSVIISIILGVLAIFSFAIELPKKIADSVEVLSFITQTPAVPLQFPTAQADEALIVVADFQNLSDGVYKGIDPAQYIYEQILSQVDKDNLSVRVERLKYVADGTSASRIGQLYNAKLVIWGEYDSVSVKPQIEKVKDLGGIKTETHRFSLLDTNRISSIVLYDMPSEVAYLTFLTLGLEKYASNNLTDATAYFNSAIDVNINSATKIFDKSDAYFYRANIQFLLGKSNSALDDYSKAIEYRSGFPEAYNNRGVTYGVLATTEKPSTDSNPQCIFWYPQYMANYTRPTRDTGKYEIFFSSQGLLPSDELTAFYTDSINSNLALSDLIEATKLKIDLAQGYYNKGVLLVNLCDDDGAIVEFKQALNIDPQLTYAINNIGNLYARKQRFQDAINEYTKALTLNPAASEIYINRGMAYEALKNYDLAIKDYTSALGNNSALLEAYYLRGWLFSDTGRCIESIGDFNFLISQRPDESSYYSSRGYCYFYTNQFNASLNDFTKAISLNPKKAQLYFSRGLVYAKLNQHSNAVNDYSQSLLLEVDDVASVYMARGNSFAVLKDYDKAILDYSEAIKLEPSVPAHYLNRARAYSLLGEKDKAVMDLRFVLTITTDTTYRQEAEQRLQELDVEP